MGFVSSFDSSAFGRVVFGHSMVADLFHQASYGFADPACSINRPVWLKPAYDGFRDILWQIAKVVNKRVPGKRWWFLHQTGKRNAKVVYIDDQATPLWKEQCVATALYN